MENHNIVGEKHIFCISVGFVLSEATFRPHRWKQQKPFGLVKWKADRSSASGGPSCETWLAALRWRPPRCDLISCHGEIAGLSSRQWKQVCTGTHLIQFLVELIAPSSPARTVRVHRASTVSGVADAEKASIDLDFAGDQNPCQAWMLPSLFVWPMCLWIECHQADLVTFAGA